MDFSSLQRTSQKTLLIGLLSLEINLDHETAIEVFELYLDLLRKIIYNTQDNRKR